jgi:HD-like signal output (HDOD) protein
MAGLVCDVGELILPTSGHDSASSEGVTHAELGAFLLGLWGIPAPIVEAVANHHQPERNAHTRLGLSQIVWLASCLVHGEAPDASYLERIGAGGILPELERMMA